MTTIHSSAIVDKTAKLGRDVIVGPGCVIGSDVIIGDGCELKSHVVIGPGTHMGCNNRAFTGCVIGEEPQILGRRDPQSALVIGESNTFREYVTIHRGNPHSGGKTIVGNNNYLMVGCHLGHDCEVEDETVMVNYCQIAGHCKIEKKAWLGGFTALHQFVTVGRFTYTGGRGGSSHDIPPFMRVSGTYPCQVRGLNLIGLQRAGMPQESIKALNQAYKKLYCKRQGAIASVVKDMLDESVLDENVRYLLEFVQRGCRHRFGRYRELARENAE